MPRRKWPFEELDAAYREAIFARIAERVVPRGRCLEYPYFISSNGYGRVAIKGVKQAAHRFVYQLFHGPLPDDLEVDHLCHNRLCIRITHLEAVSRRENCSRRRPPRPKGAP